MPRGGRLSGCQSSPHHSCTQGVRIAPVASDDHRIGTPSGAHMNVDEFRKEMWAYRQAADRDAIALENSNLAWEWLREFYWSLEADRRMLADQVLTEWLLSDDESVRYDALVLIDDFRIAAALPGLHEAAGRLRRSESPGAPFELKKVDRIVNMLEGNRRRA